MIDAIFISKDVTDIPELELFCSAIPIDLYANSLITFEKQAFKSPSAYSIVFFASIRAATFFLASEQLLPSVKVACIGKATAAKLQELGIESHFVGQHSGNPAQVALEFKKWVGDSVVLFPHSTISNGSIVSVFPTHQRIEIEVYKTILSCKNVPPCSVYVFTSPSNFESFLVCNVLPKNALLIAWGTTTQVAIENKGMEVYRTLESSNLSELIVLIDELLP